MFEMEVLTSRVYEQRYNFVGFEKDQYGEIIPLKEVPDNRSHEYDVIATLKSGVFKRVLYAERFDNRRVQVAAKTQPKYEGTSRIKTTYTREVTCLKKIKDTCPFLLHLVDCQETNLYTYIFTRWVDGLSLGYVVETLTDGLKEAAVLFYLTELCTALRYLHAAGVVHRRITPSRLLLTAAGHIVLSDFSAADCQELQELSENGQEEPGKAPYYYRPPNDATPPHFAAPEIYKGHVATEASDWWAFGITGHYLFTGKLPFARKLRHRQQIECCIMNESYTKNPSNMCYMRHGAVDYEGHSEPESDVMEPSEADTEDSQHCSSLPCHRHLMFEASTPGSSNGSVTPTESWSSAVYGRSIPLSWLTPPSIFSLSGHASSENSFPSTPRGEKTLQDTPVLSPGSLMSADLQDLLSSLLHKDPAQRMGAEGSKQLEQHPFFNGVDWTLAAEGRLVPPMALPVSRPVPDEELPVAPIIPQNPNILGALSDPYLRSIFMK